MLLLILYGTLLATSRTEGFSDLLGRRLARAYPVAWHVDSTRISPSLRLYLHGVRADDGEHLSVFQAEEMVLSADLHALCRGRLRLGGMAIRKARLIYTATPGKGWLPDAFSDWSALLHPGGGWIPAPVFATPPDESGEAPSPESPRPGATVQWPRYRLGLDAVTIVWKDSGGGALAEMRDLSLHARPMTAPGRHFTHLRLNVQEWRLGPEHAVRGLAAEWLAHERLRWILDLDPGVR